jgi:hypothetical protein
MVLTHRSVKALNCVAITDQKAESVGPLLHGEHEVAGLLGDPLLRRMPRHPEDVDPARSDLEDEEQVDETQQDRVDGGELTRQHRRGLGSAELRHDGPVRRGAGSGPAFWRRFQTVVGATR